MSKYTLENREGNLYVKYIFTVDRETGQEAVNLWPLGITFTKFATWFVSEDLAKQAVGCELQPTIAHPTVAWQDKRGWKYRLPDISKPDPEIAELLPLPAKPKHIRGAR